MNTTAETALTDARLAEIAARVAAASDGPWRACESYGHAYQVAGPYSSPPDEPSPWHDLIIHGCDEYHCGVQYQPDAAFIAAARTDIPDLLAEVIRLRALLAGRKPA